MPLSNYPNGFVNGVTLREFPILELQNGLANVFWVDSNKGADGNNGTFKAPFATLNYAASRCTANQGDKIYVAAGHAETIVSAGAIDLAIAGIQVIGLGTADNRPTFTFTTATTATMVVSAANVYVGNMIFNCNINSQVTTIDSTAANTVIDNCTFKQTTPNTGLNFIKLDGGAALACNGAKIINCKFYSPSDDNYVSAIQVSEITHNVEIANCDVYGFFSLACIYNPGSTVLVNLRIQDCRLTNLTTSGTAVELLSACTGVASNLYMYADTYANVIDPGSLYCFQCYSVSSLDKNARLNPAIET